MRPDLEALLRPLEYAKHARRRAALRSRYALVSLGTLFLTSVLVASDGHQMIAACALFACGLVVIGFQITRLARMGQAVPPDWLMLAVECRLSTEGRAALTPLLMTGHVTCDEALDWGRAERERPLDDLRACALAREVRIS